MVKKWNSWNPNILLQAHFWVSFKGFIYCAFYKTDDVYNGAQRNETAFFYQGGWSSLLLGL